VNFASPRCRHLPRGPAKTSQAQRFPQIFCILMPVCAADGMAQASTSPPAYRSKFTACYCERKPSRLLTSPSGGGFLCTIMLYGLREGILGGVESSGSSLQPPNGGRPIALAVGRPASRAGSQNPPSVARGQYRDRQSGAATQVQIKLVYRMRIRWRLCNFLHPYFSSSYKITIVLAPRNFFSDLRCGKRAGLT
jgi:hypothetical protein